MTRWQKITLIADAALLALMLLAYAVYVATGSYAAYLTVFALAGASLLASAVVAILYAIRKWGPKHRRGVERFPWQDRSDGDRG
ncbi:MAG: hypothetical protein VX464_20855 [Pseudomonadota bacterium]|nr:hypothetical protein [Pseudomonadota bacterium]